MWTLITCDNLLLSIEHAVNMLNSIGFDLNEKDMLTVGERIYKLTREISLREGFTKKDDYIPERLFEERKRRYKMEN